MDLATTHDWREGAIVPEAESCADHAAFQSFVERNMRFAFRVAWALLRNRGDADDVVQDCFLRLYRKRAWQEFQNERAYLARVVWRMARDRQRRPLEEMTSAQIGLALGIPEGTVRTRIQRARALLKQKLGPELETRHAR